VENFQRLSRPEQADRIWRALFIDHSPISENCRGVLTVLKTFGLDVKAGGLADYRHFFDSLTLEEHLDVVLQTARVKYLVMTNDPFEPTENLLWQTGLALDGRFRTALRLDKLFNDYPGTAVVLQKGGYQVNRDFSSSASTAELHRFLTNWIKLMNPLYLAVSLPPDFCYPDESLQGRIIDKVILPLCRESGRPLALMIGVKRGVNPKLGLAGDGVSAGSVTAVEHLCAAHSGNRFFVTMLSRENQHELCVAARKFSNLMPFGCWWFLNTKAMIQEITALRTELLGLSYIPQHSDARILDQLIYKWAHSREAITRVLQAKYQDLAATGWIPTEAEIRRDYEALFVNNFERFCGLSSD